MQGLFDLPEELLGCCSIYLDITSAGRFGQASKPCSRLVEGRLVEAKAARDRARRAAPFERSRYGAIVTYCNPVDDSKLVTFSDGGLFRCACSTPEEYRVGMGFQNIARHLVSRNHWKHWRLVAFGEARGAADQGRVSRVCKRVQLEQPACAHVLILKNNLLAVCVVFCANTGRTPAVEPAAERFAVEDPLQRRLLLPGRL